MIFRWEKRDDYWTNISSPDFGQCLKYRGYLETPKHELLSLRGLKKNGMRMLWHSPSRTLRQESSADTGFVLRRCPHISGSRGPESQVQEMWQGEKRETFMAGKQSLLYKAVFLLCWAEMSDYDHPGCGKRAETGLAYSQGIGQRIHAGTASKESRSGASGNRNRRDIPNVMSSVKCHSGLSGIKEEYDSRRSGNDNSSCPTL